MLNNKIGIMGGSFSPVHNGHIFLAKYVKEFCCLDKVLMIPTGTHPFKYKQKMNMPEAEHRLKMLNLALEDEKDIEVSDIEVKSSEVSYTYNTLCKLRAQYGADTKLYFIIGTDEILSFEKWYESEKLMREFSFIVGIRPKYDISKVEDRIKFFRENWDADIEIVNLPAPDVSSTEVRDAIIKRTDLTGMIPESVKCYIDENGLYF